MANDVTETEPYAAGKAAAERSEPVSCNPYPSTSEAYRQWEEGHASVTAVDEVADDLADFA